MKKIIEVADDEGLDGLLDQQVLLMCANYFYTGRLLGVNDKFVLLENPAIVYETGAWTAKGFSDAQPLHVKNWYVQTAAIESYGLVK